MTTTANQTELITTVRKNLKETLKSIQWWQNFRPRSTSKHAILQVFIYDRGAVCTNIKDGNKVFQCWNAGDWENQKLALAKTYSKKDLMENVMKPLYIERMIWEFEQCVKLSEMPILN